MTQPTRVLTQKAAEKCEMAQEPVCRCRCGGAKHGAGRVGKGGDFSLLPDDDPHYRPSLNKSQVLRLLNRALTHVIGNCDGIFTSGEARYMAWRDAQTIITDAKRCVMGAK
jgi:hypothetical protein